MTQIALTQFEKESDALLRKFKREKKELVLTERGKAFALIIPISSEENLEDYVLSTNPIFIKQRVRSRKEIAEGKYVGIKELQNLE